MQRADRIFSWLDRAFGIALAAALAGAALSAMPTGVRAESVKASGAVVSEARSVSAEFDAISVSGGIDLHVRQGAQQAVEAKAHANLLPYLETVVEGKTLMVRWKRGSQLRLHQSPTVDVTAVKLQSIASAGSSDVSIGALKTPQLVLAVSGSGDVNLESLAAEELTVKIAGSGNVKAGGGQVGKLQIKVSGSGDVQTEGLKADDVSISIAGSGDAKVHADKTLAVSIAGTGDVVYRGEAQVKSTVAGSGSVRKR
ncbi:DUF2807 domain-containing protein [Aquincola sp. S2]|uniref:DUF2807 domain-containing protein n=1 Tax=Pseudaquabacterium terrae TaxID=2732868 RepID=A0ABX2EDR5_9BURK|nr:head GIN domain-containing protein [Aquabacterium terrae]NRF66685.1 DUF2807 domain-containing protein [Aquabacterium terrae]